MIRLLLVITPRFDSALLAALRSLQNKFILTCVDKSYNDFAIICKKHYLLTLLDELTGSSNYKETKTNSVALLIKHANYLRKNNIPDPLAQKRYVPYLYLILKAHKSPVAHRFIAGSRLSSLQPLSSLLTVILKLIADEANLI